MERSSLVAVVGGFLLLSAAIFDPTRRWIWAAGGGLLLAWWLRSIAGPWRAE